MTARITGSWTTSSRRCTGSITVSWTYRKGRGWGCASMSKRWRNIVSSFDGAQQSKHLFILAHKLQLGASLCKTLFRVAATRNRVLRMGVPKQSLGTSKQCLQRPPLPELRLDVFLRFGRVLDSHARAVPFQLLANAHRHVAEQDRFGQQGRIVEVRQGRRATLDRSHPFGLLARIVLAVARQSFRRSLVPGEFLLGQERVALAVVVGGEQNPLLAHQERTAVGQGLAQRQEPAVLLQP